MKQLSFKSILEEMGNNSNAVQNQKESNPEDTITVDVPLFIRLLEYAKEDAKTDMDLHVVAETIVELSKEGRVLSMEDYSKIVSKEVEDN